MRPDRTILLSILALWLAACDKPEASATKSEAGSQPASAPSQPPEAKPATTVEHVDAAGAAKLIQDHSDLVVVDVRTPGEYGEGHIEGAVNVDFRGDAFAEEFAKLDTSKPILIHCQSGGRSTSALDTAKQLGFAKVFHLDGGMRGWREAKLPTVK